MTVKNSLDPLLFSETNNNGNKGIGLTNLKKRLDIIYFQKYLLITEHEPDYYEVHLKIDLHL